MYTTPYSSALENSSFQPVRPIDYSEQESAGAAAGNLEYQEVDLSDYYSRVKPQDLNSDVFSDVVQAEHSFSDAVVDAVHNGLDPQSAVNVQTAKAAYIASMKVAEVANSTFELIV
jgi:hypothetical protein